LIATHANHRGGPACAKRAAEKIAGGRVTLSSV